ncbi:sialic acid synthase isoform X2 [Episyrphus balteatus]|uniref:sialic acid synthase isoform X2 n=1 Tax=Episyrphus balteatus TaxID=286459 RepID=UPI00248644EB|nr:sialic acid synthase isoform X2 [Episyrphus balteatus]
MKEKQETKKKIGCNCVKFQKSCLNSKFTKSALDRPYTGHNSWGNTYGEHKAFLEFSIDEYKILQKYSNDLGIFFSASAMDEVSLDDLRSMDLPFIKIGSGDANNFTLLEKASKIQLPLIISTGMQTMSTIENIVQIMRSSSKTNFALLHCVSSYPTKPEDCNLLTIQLLQKKFPDVVIGYSGHEVVPYISEAAVLLGAKIVERHITLDKKQKGSDHLCSLTPNEFQRLIKSIRYYEDNKLLDVPQSTQFIIDHFNGDENVKKSLGHVYGRDILNCELDCRKKLGKSLVTSKEIRKGEILTLKNIMIKVSEPPGLTAERLKDCLGKPTNKDLKIDEPLQAEDIFEFK